MKTAMTELLEDIKKHIEVEWPMNKSIRDSINKALEKEKEQIINAYTNGYGVSFIDGDNRNFNRPEKYYNETYNQKETLEEWKSKFTHHCAIKTNNP